MRRREFIALVCAGVAWPFAAMAQQAGRTYRLGCLLPLTHDAPINVAFFDELRRRGFIEGKNLTVEYRAYGLHVDLISEYAAELVDARVDVIVTAGDVAPIRAAQQATKTIPILAMTGDLIGQGLVASQAQPDGNTTGVNFFANELDGKRQDILIEAVPGLRRMAFLADANFETVAKLDALQEAARGRVRCDSAPGPPRRLSRLLESGRHRSEADIAEIFESDPRRALKRARMGALLSELPATVGGFFFGGLSP